MIEPWSEPELFDLLVRRYGEPSRSKYPAHTPLARLLAGDPEPPDPLTEGLETFVHDLCHAQRFDVLWFFEPAPWEERAVAMDLLCAEFRDDWGQRSLQDEERLTAAVEIDVYRRLGFTPPWTTILSIQAPDAHLSIPEFRWELARTLDTKGKDIHHHVSALVSRFNRWRAQ